MPTQTSQAVNWAYQQTFVDWYGNYIPVTKDTAQQLVDAVRSYFNTHSISYSTFDYPDLQPYL